MSAFALLFSVCLLLGQTPPEGPALLRDTFAEGRLSAGWRQHVSSGNEIVLREGVAEIRADQNTHAYVAHALDRDCVTASARIKPSSGSAVSWCTSVFLVWNSANWCQLGVISRSSGRFYAVEMEDGVASEIEPAAADATRWHYLRIQLGRDVVRHQVRDDGTTWRTIRIIERPGSFNGAPSLVAVGKGYGTGAAPYAGPDLSNDYADRGPRVVSEVADIRVEPTPSTALVLAPAELAAARAGLADPIGAKELAHGGDPTYERVASYFPPMRHPREIVGVPGHRSGFRIDELGRIAPVDPGRWEDKPPSWIESGEPPAPQAKQSRDLTRSLADGHLPIVTLTSRQAGRRVEVTYYGWSQGMAASAPLSTYVRVRAMAGTGTALPSSAFWVRQGGPRIAVQFGRVGGHAEAFLRVPWDAAEAPESVSGSEYGARLAEVSGFWRRELSTGTSIVTPDKRVNDMLNASLCWSYLNVHERDGYPEAHDGTGFYDLIYGYSSALHCIALDEFGQHDRARRLLGTMLHYQSADGRYMQNFGLPDQGALMLAIAEHFRLTGDREWLRSVAPALVKAGDWILGQRAAASRTGIAAGLLKLPPYCDYQTPSVDYFGDTYSCVGLENAADVLGQIGMAGDARRFAAEAARYRADILRSMDASVFQHGGATILPIEPETRRIERESRYRGGEYYGLVAGCILENGLLAPNDRRAELITDHLEKRGGLTAGVCAFSGGIDHAYAYGYLLTCLQRGQIERYLLGLYGMLAYGMTRDTFSPVEVTMLRTGDNAGTLPHLYSCTQQLRTVRMLLVREDGDTLRLGEAIPRAWLAPGKQVVVTNAATRFGDVSYRIASDAHRVRVQLSPPARRWPSAIVLRLRVPGGVPLRSVRVNGRPWPGVLGEEVTLKGLRGPARIEAAY